MKTWLNLRIRNFKRVLKNGGNPFTLAIYFESGVMKSFFAIALVFGLQSTLLVLHSSTSQAATIEFPDEELSQETVMPIFDQPTAVKRRTVPLEHRLGLTLFGGLGLNDPFFSPIVYGGTLAYHFTNELGIELLGAGYTKTASQYDAPIKNATISGGGTCTNCPNFTYAPSINSLMFLNFKWSPFYGKLSITKSMVMNMMTNFYAGLGNVSVGDSSSIGGSLGLGQEFYFSSNFGFRADLRSFIYNGPYTVSKHILDQPGVNAVPSNSVFDQKMTLGLLFDVGLVYLL